MRLQFEAPVNGRVHKATVTAYDGDQLVYTDRIDATAAQERERLAKRLAQRFGMKAADVLQSIESGWNEALRQRQGRHEQAKTAGASAPANEVVILDTIPDVMRRPLCLIGGRAYAATWLSVQKTIHQGADEEGGVVVYDPPRVETENVLVVIDDR